VIGSATGAVEVTIEEDPLGTADERAGSGGRDRVAG
jgi:hypothetical protein